MTDSFLAISILFAPLIGFIVSLTFYNRPRLAQTVSCVSVFISLMAFILLWGHSKMPFAFSMDLGPWLKVGKLRVNWGITLDALSMVMVGVVTSVSLLVHIYSLGYMAHDQGRARFMAYLNLFTFTMLLLVTAPNMAQLFVGWEGVGLASYLLIGFLHERSKAGAAAMKAFIVNRVGDAGLILGICALFLTFQSLDFSTIFANLAIKNTFQIQLGPYSLHALDVIGIFLFIGAMGKSAQFGLHTWLPDAMEGPTPVSALIHAATMVTAGVFLIVRLSPLYELAPIARELMIYVGALTALFAATVALTQNDIKRIIAYSTCSQLGYMVLACGCSAYGAAIFHLFTHAFFKALLFLGAGSVIHAMSDEQDIQKMGGLYKLIPSTYITMWIGSLALAGVPFFAGYYSKDAIISATFLSNQVTVFYICLFVAFLTAFYSWRLLLITFHGKCRADEHVTAHVHESPFSMLAPLFVLAIGALISGWYGWRLFMEQQGFSWGKAIVYTVPSHEHLPFWVEHAPIAAALFGILLAFIFYKLLPRIPAVLGKGFLYKFLYHKWYVDELYQVLWVKPSLSLGSFLWRRGDCQTIDRLGAEGMSNCLLLLSAKNSRLQSGYIYHYALIMIMGIIAFIAFYYCLFYDVQFFTLISSLMGRK